MKDFIFGVWALIWAVAVSILMFSIGTLYSLGYSIWLSITGKDWKAFFKFWWKTIDGLFTAVGHALYEIAYALDMGWNVNGEILEDMLTSEEKTTFGDKEISVSASVGKLEIEGKLNRSGRIFSKVLNFFFWQKQHAIDAWNYTQAKKQLREKYFEGKGKIKVIIEKD
jgi:hypothetical protein